MNNHGILILGDKSFIGKNLCSGISKDNFPISISRHDVDLLDPISVKELLGKYSPRVIINCCWDGSSYKPNNEQTYLNNIKIFNNLYLCNNLYKKMIIFGSGLEKGKSLVSDHMRFYYEAKVSIAKLAFNKDKIIKLNIFNCFGLDENKERFVTRCIRSCYENKTIEIKDNRYFDFLYIEDLTTIIDYLIKNPPNLYYELDCVHDKKYKLSDIADIIRTLTKSQNNLSINSLSEIDYIGDGGKLRNLQLSLNTMNESLDKFINKFIC